MIDYITIYSFITTISTLSFAYFWYRRNEMALLSKEVYDAAKDKKISEEEFQIIADKLGAVIYKK